MHHALDCSSQCVAARWQKMRHPLPSTPAHLKSARPRLQPGAESDRPRTRARINPRTRLFPFLLRGTQHWSAAAAPRQQQVTHPHDVVIKHGRRRVAAAQQGLDCGLAAARRRARLAAAVERPESAQGAQRSVGQLRRARRQQLCRQRRGALGRRARGHERCGLGGGGGGLRRCGGRSGGTCKGGSAGQQGHIGANSSPSPLPSRQARHAADASAEAPRCPKAARTRLLRRGLARLAPLYGRLWLLGRRRLRALSCRRRRFRGGRLRDLLLGRNRGLIRGAGRLGRRRRRLCHLSHVLSRRHKVLCRRRRLFSGRRLVNRRCLVNRRRRLNPRRGRGRAGWRRLGRGAALCGRQACDAAPWAGHW
jgi:hypothetical protein